MTDIKNKCYWDKEYDVTELRVDPYDFKLYTKEEFFEYYGRYLEWDIQHPILIIQRKKINDMIIRYKKVLEPENINFLLDRMINTFLPFTSDWC